MTAQAIPLLDIQAQWGYCEILDSNLAHRYDSMPAVDELRRKRRNGVRLSDLAMGDRYNLAFQCAVVRSNLMVYFVAIDSFQLCSLTRREIGSLLVPPGVWHPESQGQHVSFSYFITTPTQDPRDSRNNDSDPSTYRLPSEPISVGRIYQHLVLVDGFHRAGAFWKYAPEDASLNAYVPQSPAMGFLQMGLR